MTDFGFDAPTVIRTKRDGGRLSDAAIDWVIDAYTDGRVADEQMAALLMAIFWRGMDRGEIASWTAAMLAFARRGQWREVGTVQLAGLLLCAADVFSMWKWKGWRK